jgi:hypothetical protein
MESAELLALDAADARQISPTDISQFIRLEQCQRYLRLRLHERVHGLRFLRDYGVAPQSIPPLLTRSGARFEDAVERAVRARFATRNFAADPAARGRDHDNDEVLLLARVLEGGHALVLFQPRLEVELGGWRIRGDVDLLRLERDRDGGLHLLIADMKSSTAARVEHRLQVAFYLEMLNALLDRAGMPYASLDMGILYRGPADGASDDAERERQTAQRAASERLFGVEGALFELIEDADDYRGSVRDLVTGPSSVAERVAGAHFDAIPFHLTYKCDGCLYNEFCMKRSAERDELSLLPHLTAQEKTALERCGVATVGEVAALKELAPAPPGQQSTELVPAPGKGALIARLGTTWPVGPRLDELIHRARYYRRFKGDRIAALGYIPSKGYGSLPYCDAEQNPNLVRIYVDAQHDYLHDRIYLLGVARRRLGARRRAAHAAAQHRPPD